MNPHSPHLQPGQLRFGGCRLVRELDSSPGGTVSWQAENAGAPCLLHVLPQTRLLSDAELRPLHRLRHHGQRAGRAASQMTLANVCTEDGRTPVTALVESFPPMPIGAVEWMTLLDWVKRHGPASAAQARRLLPDLARLAADLPDGGHGSLGPAHVWLACDGARLHGIVFSHAGLTPPASADADLRGLAAALFYWLTGRANPPQAVRVRALLHEAKPGGESIPAAWQEAISSSLDLGATLVPGSARELVEQMLDPDAATALPMLPPPASVPVWKQAAALAAVAVFGFILLAQINRGGPVVAEQPPTAPVLPPEPEFIPVPLPPPAQPMPGDEPETPPGNVAQVPAPSPGPAPAPAPSPDKPVPTPVPPAKDERKSPPQGVAKAGKDTPARPEVAAKTPEPQRPQPAPPRARVPYRPPPLVLPRSLPKPNGISAKKAAPAPPSPPRAQPESRGAPSVPRAIPVARATTVSQRQEPPALWQRVPSAEKIPQAVPVPEDAPAPAPDRLSQAGVLPPQAESITPPPGSPQPGQVWMEQYAQDFQANSFLSDGFQPGQPMIWDWWTPLWDWMPWTPPPAPSFIQPAPYPGQAAPAPQQPVRVPGQPDQPLWQRP